jgi:membrane protein DedA with SNARE-associated domain
VPVASFTSFVGDHSVYAIFGLMTAAAIVPVASELVMIYGGALASGALAGSVHLFGHPVHSHAWAYVIVAVAGLLGNSLGAALGWAIGVAGGRPLVERHGPLIHVDAAKLERTERWLDTRGALFVLAGLALPIVRSFVAIPAGTARMDFRRFFPAAVAGVAAFCFGLAGGGWALGQSYTTLQHDLRYLEIAVVAGVLLAVAYWIVRRRRSSTLTGRASADPPR